MGSQMRIPFTVLENGAVAVETDNNVQVQQRVNAIVSTELGQRAMRASMGLPLSRMLFDTSNVLLTQELTGSVTDQLNTYEPGLQIISVVPDPNGSNDGIAGVTVNYAPILQASTTRPVADVVTIEVGGTVKEVTTGGGN